MSDSKILIAAVVAAILSTLAFAMPMDNSKSNEPPVIRMALNEVLNKTVCPIRVEYDVKENRVPRTIKMMKCAAQPSHCSLPDVTSHDCCKHKNEHYHMGCVEMRDTVLVGFHNKEHKLDYTTLEVSVGCSCMIGHRTRASNVQSS